MEVVPSEGATSTRRDSVLMSSGLLGVCGGLVWPRRACKASSDTAGSASADFCNQTTAVTMEGSAALCRYCAALCCVDGMDTKALIVLGSELPVPYVAHSIMSSKVIPRHGWASFSLFVSQRPMQTTPNSSWIILLRQPRGIMLAASLTPRPQGRMA